MNIFRTPDGDLISYKGKSVIEDVASVVFSDTIKELSSYLEIDKKHVYTIIAETNNLLNRDITVETEYKDLVSFFYDIERTMINGYENPDGSNKDVDIQDLSNIENNDYITLSGTIKELTVYKDVKQTLIERPKIK